MCNYTFEIIDSKITSKDQINCKKSYPEIECPF